MGTIVHPNKILHLAFADWFGCGVDGVGSRAWGTLFVVELGTIAKIGVFEVP